MPPASSLLADRPVPAPPPMIGSPRAICSRNRFRMPSRELSTLTKILLPVAQAFRPAALRTILFHHLDQLMRRGVGEFRIVDVQIQLLDVSGVQAGADRVVERLACGRIVERLARLVDR